MTEIFEKYRKLAIDDFNSNVDSEDEITDISDEKVISYIKRLGVDEMCENILGNKINMIHYYTDKLGQNYLIKLQK